METGIENEGGENAMDTDVNHSNFGEDMNDEDMASAEEEKDTDDDEECYGSVVTQRNVTFRVIQLHVKKNLATSCHFTYPNGNKRVYMIHDHDDMKRLKNIIEHKKIGHVWILRNKLALVEDTPKGSYAPGFNPPPVDSLKAKKVAGKNKTSSKRMDTPPTTTLKNDGKGKKKGPVGQKGHGSRDKKGKNSTKETKLNDDESDGDDESIGFATANIKAHLAKAAQETLKTTLAIYVSSEFTDSVRGVKVYYIFFDKPLKTFYMKAEHFQAICQLRHEKRVIGNINNPAEFISRISNVKIRKCEYSPVSLWYRSGGVKQNTTEIIGFVVTVPEGNAANAHAIIHDCVEEYFFKVTKKRKTNSAGELALDYTESLLDPESPRTTGLYGWLLSHKGSGDRARAAKVMTTEINDHFKGGPAYRYDVSLDKFMVDWDIKQFLTDHVGCNSWDDLDQSSRIACFRDYPKRKLPEWDDIMEESY